MAYDACTEARHISAACMGLSTGTYIFVQACLSFPPGGGRGAVKLAPLRRRSRGERSGWGDGVEHRRCSGMPPWELPPSPSPVQGEGTEHLLHKRLSKTSTSKVYTPRAVGAPGAHDVRCQAPRLTGAPGWGSVRREVVGRPFHAPAFPTPAAGH